MAIVPTDAAACRGITTTAACSSISAYTVAPAFDHLIATPPRTAAPTASATAAVNAVPRPPGAVVRLWRQIVAAFAPRPYGAWTEAMTELQHLDGDTLRDVGAPPWLMHQIEIQRERDARSLRMLHHL